MAQFVADYLGSRGFDPEHAFTVHLLIEELFTNALRHAKGGGPNVSLRLGGEREELVVTLQDFDVDSFDPTAAELPSGLTPGSGGFGLRLIRRISDTIRYDYKERCAIITVTKRFTI
jgi:anti-sigma regulatory factor (Ser/Thr protein kinase)